MPSVRVQGNPKKLLIEARCLKDILTLFEGDKRLGNLLLGDTWHPSSGFVDQRILKGKNKVSEVLDFDYEFDGLVGFEAVIEDTEIRLVTYPNEDRELEEYELKGSEKDIRNIYNKTIEANASFPEKYRARYAGE